MLANKLRDVVLGYKQLAYAQTRATQKEAKAFSDVFNSKAFNLATTEVKAAELLGGSDDQDISKTDGYVSSNQLGRRWQCLEPGPINWYRASRRYNDRKRVLEVWQNS